MSRFTKILAAALVVGIISAFAMAKNDEDKAQSLVGKKAPEVKLKTLDGKTVQLSAERGNVVLMDYWATWCPPCRKSLPHVQALSEDKELTGKGLKVWAVNAHEQAATVKKFVADQKFTFTVPLDAQQKFGRDYFVSGIPMTVLVGRDGTVKNIFVGYGEGSDKQIHDAIESALGETGGQAKAE